jgi:hypothetical protein
MAGNVSSLSTTIKNPLTGQHLSRQSNSRQSDQSCFAGDSKLQLSPSERASANSVTNNYVTNFPGNTGFTHFDGFDLRVDHNVTLRDIVFGRISWRKMPLTAAGIPNYKNRIGAQLIMAA